MLWPAVAEGLIFGAVLVVFFLGVVYGFYTRRGSGIGRHPTPNGGRMPGLSSKSEAEEQLDGDGDFGQRGTE